MTTGPGLIMPMATATRNSRSLSQPVCCTRPFLEKGLVQQTGWLNEREFLVAVAMGMISPGPVVITATFVGYLVAGFWGSLVSTIGIFLPSFLLVLIAAPLLARH